MSVEDWRRLQPAAKPTLKELLLALTSMADLNWPARGKLRRRVPADVHRSLMDLLRYECRVRVAPGEAARGGRAGRGDGARVPGLGAADARPKDRLIEDALIAATGGCTG